jgi:hypothetical protein
MDRHHFFAVTGFAGGFVAGIVFDHFNVWGHLRRFVMSFDRDAQQVQQ